MWGSAAGALFQNVSHLANKAVNAAGTLLDPDADVSSDKSKLHGGISILNCGGVQIPKRMLLAFEQDDGKNSDEEEDLRSRWVTDSSDLWNLWTALHGNTSPQQG